MNATRKCPRCGTELPANTPEEQCPKCLLEFGIDTQPAAANPSNPADPAKPPPPSIADLAPRFPQLEILEFLGQGGMGLVYKARQLSLDRLVALKILPVDRSEERNFAGRFTQEARALARLNHPNIVAVYDFGQADGLYYLLMEYVDGLNLRQLERSGGVTPQEALKIIPAICDALQYAHNHGIVHRDIKPENILLGQAGQLKIADFGLAKLLERAGPDPALTRAEQVMGTPHYMAPEQLEHPLEVDHRADLYSLGVVFYEMLTGELPLGKFAPPSQKVEVDVRLDHVVLRALERERERRYQQATDIKTDLATVASTPTRTRENPRTDPEILAPTDPEVARWLAAQRSVRGPAIGLLVTGLLNWILIPFFGLASAYFAAGRDVAHIPVLGPLLALMVISSFMIYAALKMKAVEAWGAAVAGSILAILVSPGNWIGLPIGIWALVTLTRSSVKSAFDRKPAQLDHDQATAASGRTTQRAGDPARRWFFTTATIVLIGIVLIIVLSVGSLLVAIALPAFMRAREKARENAAIALHADATILKTFTTQDPTLAGDRLTVSDDAWLLDSAQTQTVQLFELRDPEAGPGTIFYEADLRTEGLDGRVYLEMWCRFPGRGEFFSRGYRDALSGTTGWVSSQAPFLLQQDEKPDLIRLNLAVEGTGRVWIRNVTLSHANAIAPYPGIQQ
jgi:serine/threonine protein kinase